MRRSFTKQDPKDPGNKENQ